MQIYKYPNKILTEVCSPVDIMGPQRQDYIQFFTDMLELFEQAPPWGNMVGLAAPQVGKSWRAFVALSDGGDNVGKGELFINPVKLWESPLEHFIAKEGCYSLEENKFDYEVYRAYRIKLKWQDINGVWHKRTFSGFPAQVLQHELDHLDGVCVNIKK